MFEIDFLPERRILRWRLSGFWTEETVDAFQSALHTEMARIRRHHPRFFCLSDTRHFPVQSEEVMRKLGSMAQSTANAGSKKFAILVSTALNALQAQRSFHSDRIRVFKDEGEALAWLAENPAGQANAA